MAASKKMNKKFKTSGMLQKAYTRDNECLNDLKNTLKNNKEHVSWYRHIFIVQIK